MQSVRKTPALVAALCALLVLGLAPQALAQEAVPPPTPQDAQTAPAPGTQAPAGNADTSENDADESFPEKAGNFVSDNIEFFVGGLAVAILLLLLAVMVLRRRSETQKQKGG